MDATTDQEQQPPLTDTERAAAEMQVLHPETDTRAATIMGKAIELRPLVIKKAKFLATKCEPALKTLNAVDPNTPIFTLLPQMTDALIDAYCYVAQTYDIQGCSRDWCEEHLETWEVIELLEAQLAQQRNNDFLLTGLRGLLNTAGQALAQANIGKLQLETAEAELSKQTSALQASTRPSATPGTAHSTSSSAGTPPAS